ncbi:OmpW family protein [Pseudomethylobacillus aquaticus]|uniref:OmpW family protein n=1 Tax=Pseudomethylobacillus aquaticus TaxID=2676064 RepID=A0A3N0V7H2_9PROT|nr:OmpW family outer membrane protein [Pseudomethylobacillus aquaticus]ROH88571.1 OmpW family protein [Pseudomethylobacillus aquaticus]
MIVALGLCAPMFVQAETGDWVIRGRAVHVSPNESSDLGRTVNRNVAPGAMSPGAALAVESNTIPELDISYYLSKHVAAELILALGSKHDVSIRDDQLATVGNQPLGNIDALPPTLTLQWHFNPDQKIDPYVGAGFNYTRMLDRDLRLTQGALAGSRIKVDSDSFGFAVQAGVDIKLSDGWILNADLKYLDMDTNVKLRTAGWTRIDRLDINPWLLGIGIGRRF